MIDSVTSEEEEMDGSVAPPRVSTGDPLNDGLTRRVEEGCTGGAQTPFKPGLKVIE